MTAAIQNSTAAAVRGGNFGWHIFGDSLILPGSAIQRFFDCKNCFRGIEYLEVFHPIKPLMGWDTQVGVLIENVVEEKESVMALFLNNPPLIYPPFKVYEKEIEESVGKKQLALYLSYQGRKHPPVGWIDKIAAVHPNLFFTLLGSHLDFIGGPAGLIRLKAGIILDSYGYFDRFRVDEEYLNPEMIYQWFRVDGLEESIRQNHLTEIPKCQHDDDLVSRLILLNEEEKILLASIKLKLANAGVEYGWKEVEMDWR